jgi:hypothetical protein
MQGGGGGPVVLALLDTSPAAGEDFQELLRSSLAAALEALSPGTLMGIIGFSDRISMVDMQGEGGGGEGNKAMPATSPSIRSPKPWHLLMMKYTYITYLYVACTFHM